MDKQYILKTLSIEEYNGSNGHIDHVVMAIFNGTTQIYIMMGHCIVGKKECLKAKFEVAKKLGKFKKTDTMDIL